MPPLLLDALRLTVWLLLLALVFAPAERLFSLRGRSTPRSVFADLGYFYLNGLVPALLLTVPVAGVSALVRAVLPAAYVQTVAALPFWLAVSLGLLVAEVGSYWAHRWCHRSPYLWQFHAIHHAPEHLDWLVNTRAHPVDILVTRLGGLVPLYLLGLDKAGGSGTAPMIITVVGTVWSFFVHANVRWRFGWLEQVVATPAFHHWHHTNDEYRNRNFAATLPVMDRVFGTLHLPDRYPHVYGIDHPGGPTMFDHLLRPFVPPARNDVPNLPGPLVGRPGMEDAAGGSCQAFVSEVRTSPDRGGMRA